MNKYVKRTAIAVGGLALVGGFIASPAGAAVRATAITYPLLANAVAGKQVVNGSLGEIEFDAATKAKLNKVGTKGDKGATGAQGPKGDTGATGPAGPAGANGNDAILSVTAASSLSDRPDSGAHGTWAKDALTRTVAITRQHAAKASECGGGATKCWYYTGSIVDNGSFTTVDGGKSPEAGADIAGTVSGTVAGASQIEFYASSNAPDPSKVDATVTGAAHPTGEWVKMFFPAGTVVTESDLLDWAWTYTAPATCEKWVNAKAGNTGDITGVNAC